jgi:hypothetical protein
MNKEFAAELRDLLDKWDAYISFDSIGDSHDCDEELSICTHGSDECLFSTNEVCGSSGLSISAYDIKEVLPEVPVEEVVQIKGDHWAVINIHDQFLCNQEDTVWYQDGCFGWAICSADRDWAVQNAEHTGGRVVPVEMVDGKWELK